ncbi:transposase, partial [Methylococcaceae bacterium HT5]
GSYKNIFSYPQMVQQLLEGFVDQHWVADLDFSSLAKTSGHYVSDDLRERSDDLVWKARWKDTEVYIYLLLEFQSTPDYFMAVRVSNYISLLYQDLIKSKSVKKGDKLPFVLPIVLHRGDELWDCVVDINDLVVESAPELVQYKPSQKYLLIDVAAYENEALEAVHNMVSTLFQLENSSDDTAVYLINRLYDLVKNGDNDLQWALKLWVEFVLAQKLEGVQLEQAQTLGEVATMLANNRIPWTQRWLEQGKAEGIDEGISGSRYFCESLFWASQPKQAAKT